MFLRDNRHVEPTPAGERFLRSATEGLRTLRAAQADVAGEEGPLRGVLELYASVTACYSVLPPLLAEFRREHPEAQIHLRTGDAARAVSEVRNDAAQVSVAALPPRLDRNLLAQRVTVTPLRFVAPQGDGPVARMMRRSPIPWPEVPLILPDAGLARERVDRWLQRRAIRPNIYAEVSGNEAILAMVGLELGVGVVPELVIEKSPVKERLEAVDAGAPLEPYEVGIVARRRSLQLPVVRAFWRTAERVESSPQAASIS